VALPPGQAYLSTEVLELFTVPTTTARHRQRGDPLAKRRVEAVGERATVHRARDAHDRGNRGRRLRIARNQRQRIRQAFRNGDQDERARIGGQCGELFGELRGIVIRAATSGHVKVMNHEAGASQRVHRLGERPDDSVEAFGEKARYDADAITRVRAGPAERRGRARFVGQGQQDVVAARARRRQMVADGRAVHGTQVADAGAVERGQDLGRRAARVPRRRWRGARRQRECGGGRDSGDHGFFQ